MAILIWPEDAPACSKINTIKKNRFDMGYLLALRQQGILHQIPGVN